MTSTQEGGMVIDEKELDNQGTTLDDENEIQEGKNGENGHPGDDDEHAAGHIDSEKVVGELSLEGQIHRQTAVLPCIKMTMIKNWGQLA